MADRVYIELDRLLDAHFIEKLRLAPATRPTNPASERDAIADAIEALASEGGEGQKVEPWPRCGGREVVEVEDTESGQADCPGCPDCQPESGGGTDTAPNAQSVGDQLRPESGENWPPITIERHKKTRVLSKLSVNRKHYPDSEYRRYIPAPEGSE